jgi:leucyl aminopeptidase
VIGGHYDDITGSGDPFTVAPGANDNASGVAAALEVARVFKKNDFIPSNTIKFIAFGSEELGLYGSSTYAFNASHTLVKIKFMLNNDMIAYQPGNDKTNWRVNIIDYNNSHPFRRYAEIVCRKYTVLEPYNNNTYNGSSDSYPFYNNNYKALFFFSDIMDPNYHTINDVVSNCNFEYCSEIVKLNCAILVDRN